MNTKSTKRWIILGWIIGLSAIVQAKTIYVDNTSPSPAPPYTNGWISAAHTIQEGIDVAVDGDEVMLAHRTYTPATTLVVTNAIYIRSTTLSLKDAPLCVVDGTNFHKSIFNLGTNAVQITGLTIKNGQATGNGAGVYCESDAPLLWNCILSDNTASGSGGAIINGRLNGCIVSNNAAYYGGGCHGTQVEYSTLIDNSARDGGGLKQGTAYRSTIQNNRASGSGGGLHGGSATNCIVIANEATSNGGGFYSSTAIGCAISANRANSQGGGIYQSDAYNCTLTDNFAPSGGGTTYGRAYNSILWNNRSDDAYPNSHGTPLYTCCIPEVTFNGCITNDPQLVTFSHISTNSPCVAAGNSNYVAFVMDIDSEGWNNIPAIGCDEIRLNQQIKGDLTLFNNLEQRVVAGQDIHFQAWVEGAASRVVLDYGDGTSVTNPATLNLSHTFSYGNQWVVMTAYNDDHPGGVTVSNIVWTRTDATTTIYVTPTGNDSNDGKSWANAKQTIPAALDAQIWNQGLILVSNGTYSVTTEIAVEKDVRIQGLDGAENTLLEGDSQHRAFNLGNQYGRIDGFTLKSFGGYSPSGTSGGGAVYCTGETPVVANSLFTENNSGGSGGGVMWRGTATNCVFRNNVGSNGPGGMLNGVAINCLFENNQTINGGGTGGGAMSGGNAIRCIFRKNTNANQGGGMFDGTAYDCQFIENSSDNSGGGTYNTIAENCVFRGNKSKTNGGGMYGGSATHCTLTANRSTDTGGGTYSTALDHCIVWYNEAMNGADDIAAGTATDSCSPDLEHGTSGNFTNNPQLVSASHIAYASPCAGSGSLWLTTLDIDGEHWRSTPAMGCDEPADPAVGTPTISISGPTDLPVGYQAFYMVDIQGAIERDQVDFGDGHTGIHSAIRPISNTWSSPGTYDMIVTVWNNNDQDSFSATNTITVRAADFNTIYVATNGNDLANGRTWETAKQTIQAAIDEQEFPGGQVVVSNGVYTLTETIKIDKEIQLIGFGGATNTIVDAVNLKGIDYQHARAMEVGDNHSTIRGLTICNADAGWTGGGIYCDHSLTPQFYDCILKDNKAGTAAGAFGGTFIDCSFTNNQASAGKAGGLHSGKAENCTFTDNYARDGGGGAYASKVWISTFTKNRTDNYGGGVYQSTATDCLFQKNEAQSGGGIQDSTATDCTLVQNIANGSGGGAYNSTLIRCAVLNNRAIDTSGGGMQSGTADSCYFSGNRSKNGGGGTANATLNNCTLTGNHSDGNGGGIFYGNANNSIVWNNTSDAQGNDLYYAHPNHTCSPDAPDGTDGCITNNPQLVSASHIATTSPCIGKGDPQFAPELDIDSEGWNNPPSMGCDEIGATLSGAIEMSFYGPSPIRSSTEGDYIALFEGSISKTIVDFGHGTPLTNAIGTLAHRWPGPAAQNYAVVLTGFNDDYPLGTSYTQTVEVVDAASDQYVRYDGQDTNDGLSWTNAKRTIQAAIDAQQVMNGRVVVDKNYYAIPATLTIDKPIYLLGWESSGFKTSVIVDAGSSNRCMDIAAVDCKVENFTFKNGAASTQGFSNNEGGGVRCQTLDPEIKNSTFVNCTAYYGGAAYKGTLSNCVLSNNVATSTGGAVSGSRVEYCTVSSNTAQYGGGISGVSFADHSTLSGNHATRSGGGAYSSSGITNSTLMANTADTYGGGAYQSDLQFCTITSNAAPAGGGLYRGTIDQCLVSSNNASATYGGGMNGGTANSSIFYFNRAEEKGGGTYGTSLNNCTVATNGAFDTGGSYSGTIRNSIIWGNFALTNAANVAGTTPMYSCFPEADPSSTYYHNLTNDPQFVSYPPNIFMRGSDFYLGKFSPCLNAGRNDDAQPERDYNDWPRVTYGTVDMGAHEIYFFSADTDGDDMPDGWELENFGGVTNAVAGDDADGDAFDNRSEYIAGTDVFDDTSYLHITQSGMEVNPNTGNTTITLYWSPSVAGRTYGVQWSTNLVDGFQDRGLTLPYPSDQISFGNDLPASFYTISVKLDN